MIIYTKENCPKCESVKSFFKENDIKFEERKTVKPKFYKDMIIKGWQMLPVIVFENNIAIQGANVKRVKELLKL